jgi:vacuole morphology and inheritance protein 14
MLLPQTSAFTTLRNRLNSIQLVPAVRTVPSGSIAGARKPKEDLPFVELLTKFRNVQIKQERARHSTNGSNIGVIAQRTRPS